MSEMSRNARRAMRAKIHRLTQGATGKVDASDYGPEETISAGVKTGMRPVSRRAFKKGGKVVANEGKDAVKHAGKKPRSGGKPLSIDALVNRNYKDANESREGKKHIGGLKTGGRAERASGGSTYGVSTPLRLMKTHKGPNGHTAKVYKDQDWGEYRVKHYDPEGKHLPKADYHTGDREDAHDSAAYAVENGFKRGGSKKAGGGPLSQMDGDLYGLKTNPNPNKSTMMKKGGSAKKAGGGANYPIRVPIRDVDEGIPDYVSNMGVGPYLKDAQAAAAKAAAAQRNRAEAAAVAAGNREPMEMMPPRQTPGMIQRKKGGKVPVRQWEGSAKDKAQDKKLAKKHHETFEEWEGSAADRKHDKQQSMKGLRRGGSTSLDGAMQTQEKVGGRIAKRDGGGLANLEMASGGRAKKSGKTNINIIIGTGQKPPMGFAPGMPQPPGGIPIPVPPAGAGGPPPMGMPPMGMPPGMPPAGGPPPMPMPMPPAGGPPMGRKRGGRAGHYEYGSGGGKGRLEKIDEYGEKQKK